MSEPKTTSCPKCGKENPIGAKFCSGCAANLAGEPPPHTPPPPPPNSRPGFGSMMGQMGGKVEQRQVAGEPAALYAAIEQYVANSENGVVKSQFPPQQIVATLQFKDFMATMNAPVLVDTEITIAPAGAGQSTVTVTGKTDHGSATKLWMFGLILTLIGFMFVNWILFLFLGVIFSIIQLMTLNSRGPKVVADELFAHLAQHGAGAQSQTNHSSPPPGSGTSSADTGGASSPGASSSTQSHGSALAERIRQLDELLEQGLISEDEYAARRTEILKEI